MIKKLLINKFIHIIFMLELNDGLESTTEQAMESVQA